MTFFNISNHQNTSSYVCFCSCQWCGMAQSFLKQAWTSWQKGHCHASRTSNLLPKGVRADHEVLKNILAVGMGLGQGRLDGLPPNVLWEVSCIWFVFVFLFNIYVCGNPFGQGFNSILLVKDLGGVDCFLRWVHGTNMEALAKRDSHQ